MLPNVGVRLSNPDTAIRLRPWALYDKISGRVDLDARYVSYQVAPSPGASVVKLDSNGVVHGLRTGKATIIGHFGAATDQVQVTVEAK